LTKGFKKNGKFIPTEEFGIPRRTTKRRSVETGVGRKQEIQMARIQKRFPNDNPQPDPIGNISSTERMLAEIEVNSVIDFVGFSDDVFQFDNKEEWWIFNNFDDAKNKAVEQQEFLLNQDSSVAEDMVKSFPEQKFVFITDTDLIVISNNDAKMVASDNALSDAQRDLLADEIKTKLEDDPVDYLLKEGNRTFDGILKLDWIRVDKERIAEFIVNKDGVANTLSKNGRQVIIKDKNGNDRLFMYKAT